MGVDLEDEDSASSENGSDSSAQEVEAGSQESRCAEDPESCASTASNPARRALRSLMYSLSDRAAARMEAEGYNPDTGEYDNHGFSIAGMDVEVTSRRSDRFAGAGLGWGATSGRGGSEGGGLTSADQAYNHGVNAAMLQGGADTLRALPTIGEQLVNLTLPPTPATTTEWSPTHLAMQIGAWEIEQSGIPTWLEAQAQQQLALGMANDGPSALDGVIDGGLFFYLAPFVLPSPLGKGGSAGRAAANADDLARAATIEVTKVDDLARVVDETAGGAGSSGTLTAGEIFEIQGIAKQFNTTIDVVGSRAAGQGRNIETNFPVGKEPPGATRSDIDFRVDANHPQVDALCSACQKVGGGAGSASPRYSNNPASVGGRETVPPYIRFTPDGVELIPPEGF